MSVPTPPRQGMNGSRWAAARRPATQCPSSRSSTLIVARLGGRAVDRAEPGEPSKPT